jgi:hypothetical protein
MRFTQLAPATGNKQQVSSCDFTLRLDCELLGEGNTFTPTCIAQLKGIEFHGMGGKRAHRAPVGVRDTQKVHHRRLGLVRVQRIR